MAVLIMDGEQRSSLAVVRSLGQRGVLVDVAAASEESLAGVSRFASGGIVAPSPTREPLRFQEWFKDVARRNTYEMLLPMTDASVNLVTQVIGENVIEARIPLPSHRVCMTIQDKGLVMSIAQQVSVPSPATWQPGSETELNEVLTRISFPVVVKPRFSARLNGNQWVRGPVSYAHNAEELRTAFTQSLREGFPPLIQEMIYGEGRGVFLFVWDGKLKAAFCHRRLREKPPWGGVSVLRDSVPYDAQLVDDSFRLLQSLGWDRGAAMVEYKRDSRDGRLKLMEINGRFWGSLQLAVDAGMDIPWMAYQAACGENVPSQTDYRVGVISRWFLGDLDHLLISLRKRTAWDDNGKRVGKGRVVREFLTTFGAKNEIARWADIQPALFELKEYVRSLGH
jgi:predicted ATP-grasp superfamily ATP-dependent carboligase